jgi:hypothetical protein
MPLILALVLILIPLIGLTIVVGDTLDNEELRGAYPGLPLPYRPDAI